MLRMILSLTLAAAAVGAQPGDTQLLRRVVALLDYVGGDYARAVGEHGEVLSQAEHSEQIGFVEDAVRELRADVNGRGEDLAKRLDALRQRVAERAPPAEVAQGAQAVRDEIVQRFNVVLLPLRAPDVRRGARVYAQACAACHGIDGHPNPALGLETRPPDFHSEGGPLTPQRIFSAATYGVPKTAMPAFDSGLTDEERWDVAFFILSLAHPAASPRGLELARAALVPTRYADLAALSDDDLRRRLAAAGLAAGEQEEALAALRGGPFAEDVRRSSQGLAQARAAVQNAVLLARHGDTAGARRALISAYLDHFEPHEAGLRVREGPIVQEVEAAFLALRASIDSRDAQLEARAARLDGLLEKADARSAGGGQRGGDPRAELHGRVPRDVRGGALLPRTAPRGARDGSSRGGRRRGGTSHAGRAGRRLPAGGPQIASPPAAAVLWDPPLRARRADGRSRRAVAADPRRGPAHDLGRLPGARARPLRDARRTVRAGPGVAGAGWLGSLDRPSPRPPRRRRPRPPPLPRALHRPVTDAALPD